MLLRIDHIYIQFNCAHEYNIDAEVPNTVTFTWASSDTSPSNRLAALAEGQSYAHEFEARDVWVFQVCSTGRSGDQVTAATLSIHTTAMGGTCPHNVTEGQNDASSGNSKARVFFLEFLEFSIITSIVLLPPATVVICCVRLVVWPRQAGTKTRP